MAASRRFSCCAARNVNAPAAANKISVRSQCGIPLRRVSDLRKVSAIESVPESAEIFQIERVCGIALNLLPQVGNMVVDDPFGRERIAAPGARQKLIAAEDAPARADEERQQFELDGR